MEGGSRTVLGCSERDAVRRLRGMGQPGSTLYAPFGADRFMETKEIMPEVPAANIHVLGRQVEHRARVRGTWLNIFDVTVPAGIAVPRHSHASPEIIRVVEGRLHVWQLTDDGPLELEASAGDIVRISAYVPHAYSNPDEAPAVLSVTVDSDLAEFYDALASADAQVDAFAEAVAVATEHGVTILAA